MLKPRRDVLSKLYNEPISRSAVRIMESLPASISSSNVKRLLKLLRDDRSARALQQAEQVSVELIEAMVDLPIDFRCPNVSTLIRAGVSASGLEHAIFTACHLLSMNEHIQAVREFSRLKDSNGLDSWAEGWNETGRRNQTYASLSSNIVHLRITRPVWTECGTVNICKGVKIGLYEARKSAVY